jgi:hypothetical protein
MRLTTIVLAASMAGGLSLAGDPAARAEVREVPLGSAGQRQGPTTSADRGRPAYLLRHWRRRGLGPRPDPHEEARLSRRPLWGLIVSPAGNMIAYIKLGDRRGPSRPGAPARPWTIEERQHPPEDDKKHEHRKLTDRPLCDPVSSPLGTVRMAPRRAPKHSAPTMRDRSRRTEAVA